MTVVVFVLIFSSIKAKICRRSGKVEKLLWATFLFLSFFLMAERAETEFVRYENIITGSFNSVPVTFWKINMRWRDIQHIVTKL